MRLITLETNDDSGVFIDADRVLAFTYEDMGHGSYMVCVFVEGLDEPLFAMNRTLDQVNDVIRSLDSCNH